MCLHEGVAKLKVDFLLVGQVATACLNGFIAAGQGSDLAVTRWERATVLGYMANASCR